MGELVGVGGFLGRERALGRGFGRGFGGGVEVDSAHWGFGFGLGDARRVGSGGVVGDGEVLGTRVGGRGRVWICVGRE